MFREWTSACKEFVRIIDGMNIEYLFWGDKNTEQSKITKKEQIAKYLYIFLLTMFY